MGEPNFVPKKPRYCNFHMEAVLVTPFSCPSLKGVFHKFPHYILIEYQNSSWGCNNSLRSLEVCLNLAIQVSPPRKEGDPLRIICGKNGKSVRQKKGASVARYYGSCQIILLLFLRDIAKKSNWTTEGNNLDLMKAPKWYLFRYYFN